MIDLIYNSLDADQERGSDVVPTIVEFKLKELFPHRKIVSCETFAL